MGLQTRQLALFVVLAATTIGVQLAPRPPNIESTSLITFLVGVVLGGPAGAVFGTLVMFINGFLSPWGFAGLILPFQIVGMSLIGAAGGILRKYGVPNSARRTVWESAVLGSFLTLVYDVLTNVGVALVANVPVFFAFITGVTFSFTHIVSNTLLFGLAFTPLLKTFKDFGELKTIADK